jgi:NAD(P)-dependent dehydrogenase (short-subunit alcohol dehydrogenase family)
MNKTVVVCGYGPGISNAVAERFGAEGFAVALAGRNAARVAAGAKARGAEKLWDLYRARAKVTVEIG